MSIDSNIYLKAEKAVKPNYSQQWIVYTYVLADQMTPELTGMVIFFGAFSDQKEAKLLGESIVNVTGISTVLVSKACKWNIIAKQASGIVSIPSVDSKTLSIQDSIRHKKELKELEIRKNMDKELNEHLDKQLDPKSIEHYIHQCRMAIDAHVKLVQARLRCVELEKQYNTRINNIKALDTANPDFKNKWLNALISTDSFLGTKYKTILSEYKLGL